MLLVAPALIVLSIIFACIAAARPQWGNETEEVEQQGIDLVIVVDVSASMLSTDAQPSRWARPSGRSTRSLAGWRVTALAW